MGDDSTPSHITPGEVATIDQGLDKLSETQRESLRNWAKRMSAGAPFLSEKTSNVYALCVNNLWISHCYDCKDISIWLYDRLIYPIESSVSSPNIDLPDDVKIDYLEAASILNTSPRGSAALLRLAIQKLSIFLGEDGSNLNKDIGNLVNKGLDLRVQQALDVVRVVGNNAVHPGQINVADDKSVAERLFGLVNLIADFMISQPKHVAQMYASLPESARNAIEKRDTK